MRQALRFLIAAAVLPGGGVSFAQPASPLQAQRLEPAPPIVVPEDPQDARCRRLMREFAVSSACYSRFRTPKGIKGEAFDRCGPQVNDPRGAECPMKR